MAARVPTELETAVEKRFVKKAKALGWRTRKLNGLGNKGWPDQLVATPFGVVAFVEFKRVGKEPTKLQWANLNWLRRSGHFAEWFDDDEAAIRWIDELNSENMR